MNNDAAVAISFALPALINSNIGLKKIPPPIPTIPDINPIELPIKKAKIFEIFLWTWPVSSNDLKLKSNKIPATINTKNNRISKKLLLIDKVPPINARGIDEIR